MGLRDDVIEAGSRAAAQERGLDVEQSQNLCFQMEAAFDAMLDVLETRKQDWEDLIFDEFGPYTFRNVAEAISVLRIR